ncbi:hypothetical protein JQC92_18465 [Shewanella sp. 202IG2-18]|uniref:hypothetical protein n=1 Tax=Parashewanella hymeniacidonis TaxID=2807618 RepID=UPI0019613FE1|nr:hypothetical protein [Parashewanella hymeniacidonis]MBM7073992.1 hypothetical protein [Parashewanella hymeniacidonis]
MVAEKFAEANPEYLTKLSDNASLLKSATKLQNSKRYMAGCKQEIDEAGSRSKEVFNSSDDEEVIFV